jgi:MFS family permease
MTIAGSSPVFAGNQWKLSLAQLFSGVGTAVGFAVGGLLAEHLTGKAEYAGFAQTASIIGAGVLAIPLARLAARHSRRHSLSLGFAIALAGAVTILAGARLGSPVIFFVGMFLFGSATATGLQTRYAATDDAPPHLRGRALSIVVWATTIGSVAGPNLAGPGGVVGERLGVGELGGPFALSAVAFLVAIGFTMLLRRSTARRRSAAPGVASGGDEAAGRDEAPDDAPPARHASLGEAMRIVLARPRALLGFAAVVLGHTVMVSVMVMTPVHMSHHGDSIEVIGIVISMHILGMYALSPVYGYLSDRFGPVPVIWAGFAILTAAAALGILDDAAGSSMPRISTALTLLGLGWSACFIAGSTLLTASVPESHRVVIQGAADAGMNLGAAAFAAAAGPLLAVGGFTLINVAALGIIAVGVAVAMRSLRAHRRAEAAAQAGG